MITDKGRFNIRKVKKQLLNLSTCISNIKRFTANAFKCTISNNVKNFKERPKNASIYNNYQNSFY